MSNNNSSTNKPPFFNLIETATTVVQKQTEKECQPYFIDLSKLSQSETQALQSIGLIQQEEEDIATNKETSIPQVQLLRQKHRTYLQQVWKQPLKSQFVSLDSSRPWILYWCLQGYDLMSCSSNSSNTNQKCWISSEEGSKMVTTLEDCWQGYYVTDDDDAFPDVITIVAEDNDRKDDELFFAIHEDDENRTSSSYSTRATKLERTLKITPNTKPRYYCGGFGGGPHQMAHAATTYAAILCLCILATDDNDNDDNEKEEEEDVDVLENENTNNDDDYSNLHYSQRARQMLQEIRLPLYRWMCSLQVVASSSSTAEGGRSSEGSSSAQPEHEGGYRMHHDGEIDVRATYTIACCAHLLGFLQQQQNKKKTNPITNTWNGNTVLGRRQVIEYVISCQTYEGGMGGEPYSEAHGGYTYCGIAAYQLLTMNTTATCDDDTGATTFNNDDTTNQLTLNLPALCGWLARRQTSYEGGFSGRTNKLVDGCYSFWIGGAMAIVSSMMENEYNDGENNSDNESDNDPWLTRYYQQQQQNQRDTNNNNNNMMDDNDKHNDNNTETTNPSLSFPLLYNVHMLERYILLCAQEPTGGLRDKPSKPRDFYHTNYNLCGLSIAQHTSNSNTSSNSIGDDDDTFVDETFGDEEQTVVESTHPLYNIRIDRVAKIINSQW